LPVAIHGFLSLMFLMLANSMFFYHEHNLESGETIRHAHPFLSEEEEQNRDHTENEILWLDMITHVQYYLPDLFGFVSISTAEVGTARAVLFIGDPDVEFFDVLTLRGPPNFENFLYSYKAITH